MTTWTRWAPAAVLTAVALAACAGNDGGGSGGSWSGGGSRGAPTVDSFPEETQTFMVRGLKQFSRGDPGWETTRAQWLSMGERESSFLVQAMWEALLRAQSVSQPQLVERARHELVFIGEPALPFLGGLLAEENVYLAQPEGAPEDAEPAPAVDDVQRREAAEILGVLGAPAVPALARASDGAATKGGRRFALYALGNMGERGGADAAAALMRSARSTDDIVRVEAVYGLRSFSDAATRDALFDALGDPEELVRKKAAEALAVRGDAAAVPALRAAIDRARGQGRIGEARDLARALGWIETRRR